MEKKILIGHISEATAYVQDDYPYGRLRCQRKVWVETKPKFGQRVVARTENPKTGRWNAPKAGQYHSLVVLFLDLSNNHVETASLSGHNSLEQIEKFEQEYAEALQDERSKVNISYLKAAHRAMSKVTWTVEVARQGDPPHQTPEEQAELLHKLTLLEMKKEKK